MPELRRRGCLISADKLAARLVRGRGLLGIAVMGPTEHTAPFVSFLPDRLRQGLLGTARLNPTVATAADVAETTWQLQAARERADERVLVERVEASAADGWAVNSARDSLRVLARGQVRTLVVPEKQSLTGFRCSNSGRLVTSRVHCRGEGTPMPVPNLIDAAIDEALRQRAEVRVIDDPELAGRIDGLAALLRFQSGRS